MSKIEKKSVHDFLCAIEEHLNKGVRQFTILFATAGGDTVAGMVLHNFIKGCGAHFTMWNIGNVDSIGIPMYTVGQKRYCVPNASFLFHAVEWSEDVKMQLPELREKLESLEATTNLISTAVAHNIEQPVSKIMNAMKAGESITAEKAKAWGLVHEIRENFYVPGMKIQSVPTF